MDKKVNIIWISGSFFKAKALFARVKEKLKDAECFQCNEETSPAFLIEQFNSNQCFAENKLVVIFALPDMTESQKKKLKSSLENLDKNIFAVFYMISPSSERAMFNIVEKVGKVYDFEDKITIREANNYTNNRATELGFSLSQDAIESLVNNCGIDSEGKNILVDIIEMYLERLSLFAPGKKEYTKEDIIATTVFYENFVIWDLIKACEEKDYDQCLNMFSKAGVLQNNGNLDCFYSSKKKQQMVLLSSNILMRLLLCEK